MDYTIFNLLRLAFFFIFFYVSFKIMIASNIEHFFKKYAIWQIQLAIIFIAIIMAYLVSEALVSLMETTFLLFG